MASKPFLGIESRLEGLGYGKDKPGDWAGKDFLGLITPGVRSGIEFGNTLEGARQSNVTSALSQFSPGNVQAQTQRGVDQLLNMGQAQGDQQAQSLRAQGFGKEYQAAAQQSAAGQAQRQANQVVSSENDRMNQAYLNAMQIIQEGQKNPLFNQAVQLMQMLESSRQGHLNRQAQSEASGLGALGGLFGAAGQVGAAAYGAA